MTNTATIRMLLSGMLTVILSGQMRAQEIPPVRQPYLFFPHPMQKDWQHAIGFTLTALPQDLTEEIQIRVPAIDYQVTRKIKGNYYLNGRINTQVIQSHMSVGLRWAKVLSQRWSVGLGDDIAFWYGVLNIASFRTNANGWMNYPSASVGYRAGKNVLLTLKGEALLNLQYRTDIADEVTDRKGFQFSGFAGSFYLEQPFHKKLHIITGFRAQYSNFFWQTWPLFETFDRHIFYPEITVGFIL